MKSGTRSSIALLASLCLALFSCGNASNGASSASSSEVTGARTSSAEPARSASAAPTPPSVPTSPSFKAVRPGAMHVGYLDLKGLRTRGWFNGLDHLPDEESMRPVKETFARCGGDPLEMVDELVWSGSQTELSFAAKLAVPGEKILACVNGLVSGGRHTTEAGKASILADGLLFIVDGEMLYGGTPDWARELASGKAPFDPLLAAKIAPRGDRVIDVGVDIHSLTGSPVNGVDLEVTTSATRLIFKVTGEAQTEAVARDVESSAHLLLAGVGEKAPQLPMPVIERDGVHLSATLTKEGSVEKQVEFVGTLSALSVYGVSRYLKNAKAAEARNTVGLVARRLVENVAANPAHAFPPSAAPVPREVPKGVKVQAAPGEWSGTWKKLHFDMEGRSQYYRYRIDTSPDGKTCSVIAEGDLDGNGVSSRFSMLLTRDEAGNAILPAEIKVENELE